LGGGFQDRREPIHGGFGKNILFFTILKAPSQPRTVLKVNVMNDFDTSDHVHMARAVGLAARGLNTTDPNPRVGCVVVRDGVVVGEGWHVRAGEAHAEVVALRAAGAAAGGATVYVSLEPCSHHGRTPPCVQALIQAGVARVVCAMGDPNPRVQGMGIKALRAAGIAVDSGLLEAQALELNCGFVKRMTRGVPWVRVKLAASLDGRTALANGASRWITGEAARADVQRWRARSSAILTGSGTVLEDDPQLDVRDASLGSGPRQPWRVVADSELRIPLDARVLADPARAMVFTSTATSPRSRELQALGARVEAVGRNAYGVDLAAVLRRLGALEVNEVWVESGPRLAGALIEERLADELVVYLAPHLLGATALGMFRLPALDELAHRVRLRYTDVRFVGNDLRIMARPAV
jgi:diaminohydroxyphosphoribosylaminopyrimidine deaminase/5-amino-6-(5-phosphoribosylamino)uracil reductase